MVTRPGCHGAGEGIDRGNRGGGARWNRRGTCAVCGKNLKLTPSGRIPRHVPKPDNEPLFVVYPDDLHGPFIGRALAEQDLRDNPGGVIVPVSEVLG